MKQVEISTGKSYKVLIGNGILSDSGRLIAEVSHAKTAAIVTDDIVNLLYADTLEASLKSAGFNTVKFVFPNGEGSKNINTYSDMLEFMAENRLTRSDLIVALGGGVTGDMAGFTAATYLRGIDFVQIPTTLLAMVDSSVGGKTAIDLNAGKNLAGAFYQPSLVIADTDTLSSLKPETFADGMAETIKYGVLFDRDFFDFLLNENAKDLLEETVEKCVCFKRDTVNADENDRGIRGLLNLGHTAGHAIEKCSGYSVSHGSAVAIGMVIIARGAYKSGIVKEDITPNIVEILEKYNLPTQTDYTADELFKAAGSDKKCDGGKITLIIPETVGKCRLYKTEFNEFYDILKKGLK